MEAVTVGNGRVVGEVAVHYPEQSRWVLASQVLHVSVRPLRVYLVPNHYLPMNPIAVHQIYRLSQFIPKRC